MVFCGDEFGEDEEHENNESEGDVDRFFLGGFGTPGFKISILFLSLFCFVFCDSLINIELKM